MFRSFRPTGAVVLVMALVCLGTAGGQAASPDDDGGGPLPFEVHEETLTNGLRVIVVPLESDGLVAYRTVVRTGARDEVEKGRTGFAHFFEHMMFRGTKKYPQDRYQGLITSMGADTNAYTSSDVTVYQLNIVADDLDKIMELESDRFGNLSYSKEVFQTEAGAVYGEYRKNKMSPWFLLWEGVHARAFDKHTYGHTAMGYEADIKNMPGMYDYSRRFFSQFYRPENTAVVVAGDVEPERVFALAARHYSGWKRGYKAPRVPREPEQKEERRVRIGYPGKTLPMVWVGYKGAAFDADDRVYAASHVLGELAFGETSDIYRELVIEGQVVQELGVSPADSRDPGLWSVFAVVKKEEDVPKVIEKISEVARRYRETVPDEDRVAAVRSHVRYDFILGLASPVDVAGTLAQLVGQWGSVDAVATHLSTIAEVTAEDVREAARRTLVDSRRTIAILSEEKK